ncbi:ATP-grasp domain-containing protein [Dactylosporangium sp. CA-092794]|uniref:ATP-grasp domain-containing protein n=1 Tax=Dactylosporangium sp. CA-092794 TaxID=3239929 RepID=UPI003D8B5ABB
MSDQKMSTKVLMVMPYLDYIPKAREEGFQIFAIWDRKVAEGSFGAGTDKYLADIAEVAETLLVTDFDDHEGYREALHKAVAEFEPEYLYHVGAEESMLLAYQVAEELGIEVNPVRSIEILNDKLELRRTLAEHDLSPVRYAHAPRWQDVAALLDGFTLPVVVKPTELSGSRGVLLLHDEADLATWGTLLESYGYDGPVLVEEYLRGPEFSVETISARGVHHVIGVTRKILGPPPLFVEFGHVHPEPPSPDTDAIAKITVDLLTVAGYRNGPAHTEVKLTPDGPRIVESQARLGGDRIPHLVKLSSGFDIMRSVFVALSGRPLDPVVPTASARIHYFTLPLGTVRSVDGLDEARALDFVYDLNLPFGPGDVIPETVDWRTRHGFVIVSGESAEQTLERAHQVEALLTIDIAPTAGDPA